MRSRAFAVLPILVLLALGLTGPVQAQLTAPPTVSGLDFSFPPETNGDRIGLEVLAADDFTVDRVEFSAIGVRADDLISALGGVESIREAGVTSGAADRVAAAGSAFLEVRSLAATPDGDSGRYVAELPVAGGLPADAVLVAEAVAFDDEGNASVPVRRVLAVDSGASVIQPANATIR